MAIDVAHTELDGIGNLIASIVTRISRKWQKDFDELFQEAVVIYLENKHKYDPARGQLTTFVSFLIQTRLRNAYRRQKSVQACCLSVDVARTVPETISPEAVRLLEVAREAARLRSLDKRISYLAQELGCRRSEVEGFAEEIFARNSAYSEESMVYTTST